VWYRSCEILWHNEKERHMRQQDEEKTGHAQETTPAGARRRFLAGVLTGGLVGSLLASGVGVYAQMRYGPGWFRASHVHVGGHRHGFHDAEFTADWLLSRINASEEQRQQVQGIVQEAVQELLQVHEQHHQHKQAWLDTLVQPSIDRGALEQLRSAELQLADTASQRLVEALASIADVLTPVQRSELIALATRWHDGDVRP
jgi:Spy/CpxP family protein refolding chaperone